MKVETRKMKTHIKNDTYLHLPFQGPMKDKDRLETSKN